MYNSLLLHNIYIEWPQVRIRVPKAQIFSPNGQPLTESKTPWFCMPLDWFGEWFLLCARKKRWGALFDDIIFRISILGTSTCKYKTIPSVVFIQINLHDKYPTQIVWFSVSKHDVNITSNIHYVCIKWIFYAHATLDARIAIPHSCNARRDRTAQFPRALPGIRHYIHKDI